MTQDQKLTVDQAAQNVVSSMEAAIAQQLKNYVDGIDAINRVSVLTQQMATQRMVIGVLVRQRLLIEEQRMNAISNPILSSAIEAHAQAMDEQIILTLEDIGIPKKLAQEQIRLAISHDEDTVVGRRSKKNGQIISLKPVNGN